MDDSSRIRSRSYVTTTVLCSAFLIVFYVLSIGPMSALHDRGVFGDWDEAIVGFYTPLIWVHRTIPASRTPIEAWIGIWANLL